MKLVKERERKKKKKEKATCLKPVHLPAVSQKLGILSVPPGRKT